MRTIPGELDEAARVDGAGPGDLAISSCRFGAALAVVAVFTALGVWNDFFGPLLYLNDPDWFTVAVALATEVSAGRDPVEQRDGGHPGRDRSAPRPLLPLPEQA